MNTIRLGFVIFLFCSSKLLLTQDLEPWAYGNLPVKMNALLFSYAYVDGNVVSDAGSPIQDFRTTTNNLAAGYIRTFSFFGKLGRIQLVVPFSFMSGSLKFKGNDTSGTRTGFSDPRLRIGFNIFGSPPLEPQNFRTYRQEAIIGASMVITMPLGLYYPDKVVNLGTNRWGFRPEIGASLRIGQFFWEIYGGVRFTTSNYEYMGNKTLKQSPLYGVQTHISHTFNNFMRLAFSGTYVNGGQSTVNDVQQNDYIRHLRAGISYMVPIDQFNTIALQVTSNITANVTLDYKSISLSYNHTWF
jgi:hypothetical protein